MSEGRPLISSSRLAAGDVARHSFAIVRRGFDTDEVRTYLQSVSRSIETLEQKEEELRTALADAEQRAAHPVIDETTLTASLGHHSAQVLRRAHEEAARIVAQAQENVSNMLRDTQSHVDDMQARAEASAAERVVEAELAVANVEQEARDEKTRILDDAGREADEAIETAKEEGRALLEQVHESRRSILADLTSRRRALAMQIEKLRAARDEMAGTVQGVRHTVDEILSQLEGTDEAARHAAATAGDQMRLHGPPDEFPDDAEESAQKPAAQVGETAQDASPSSAAETPASAPSVDDLFARIRAGSEVKDAKAQEPPEKAVEKAQTAGEADKGARANEPARTDDRPAADEHAGPDAALVQQRDELLAPVAARLNRSVKRALGDEQNRMLDLLRSAPSTTADALLGPEQEHVETFEAAAHEHLADAFGAGTRFGGADSGSLSPGDAADRASTGLARTIVTMLRRRIADGADDPSRGVSAAFREWRGERVERLAGDHATLAFSAGVIAAAGPGGKVRWVLTSASGCSDCDDNALAGAVLAPESFPTGHVHPPAHAGCRCLVAPTTD